MGDKTIREMKQTAVEWLVQQYYDSEGKLTRQDFEQAKEMEKQQIIDAYNNGQQIPPFKYAGQYYNETFNK